MRENFLSKQAIQAIEEADLHAPIVIGLIEEYKLKPAAGIKGALRKALGSLHNEESSGRFLEAARFIEKNKELFNIE